MKNGELRMEDFAFLLLPFALLLMHLCVLVAISQYCKTKPISTFHIEWSNEKNSDKK
jgi:hypothetical protein